MGETAENVAERWRRRPRAPGRVRARVQQRAVAAIEAGRFDDQIVPIRCRSGRASRSSSTRRAPARRHVDRGAGEARAGVPRGRHRDGRQQLGHQRRRRGALLVEASRARELGLRPLAAWSRRPSPASTRRSWASGRCRRRARRSSAAGIDVDDLDLVELNEAFASQSLVCIDELGLDPSKVNVNGGAIALGHPLGMSGRAADHDARHELRRTRRRYGLATMCIGVGQASPRSWSVRRIVLSRRRMVAERPQSGFRCRGPARTESRPSASGVNPSPPAEGGGS
jgi:3-oxo-5,6-didehydrosuberyl-CoA/3-oxoadipyl-CoA thiolase